MTEQQSIRLRGLAEEWGQARERLVRAQDAERRAAAEFTAFVRSLENDDEKKAGRK